MAACCAAAACLRSSGTVLLQGFVVLLSDQGHQNQPQGERAGASTVDQFFWSESRTLEFLGHWRWKRWWVQKRTEADVRSATQAVVVCENVLNLLNLLN